MANKKGKGVTKAESSETEGQVQTHRLAADSADGPGLTPPCSPASAPATSVSRILICFFQIRRETSSAVGGAGKWGPRVTGEKRKVNQGGCSQKQRKLWVIPAQWLIATLRHTWSKYQWRQAKHKFQRGARAQCCQERHHLHFASVKAECKGRICILLTEMQTLPGHTDDITVGDTGLQRCRMGGALCWDCRGDPSNAQLSARPWRAPREETLTPTSLQLAV